MHCSIVIKVKSEILAISLGKQVILTFEQNTEKLISNTSISHFILVFSFLFRFFFFTYLCNEAIIEYTLGQQLMRIRLKKSHLPLRGWEKS